jgi:hypothetical protein
MVARCGDAFTLIAHDALFGSIAEAGAAIRARSDWRDGGFVAIDWPHGAAVVRADLAEIIAPLDEPKRAA